MKETGRNGYQKKVKDRLELMFPGCLIFKLDCNEYQGITDLLILFNDRWASLETKAEEESNRRPNQEYYVNLMNHMSFSRFVYPEIEELVFQDLFIHFYN